jgi:hypothetical protein
MIESVIHTSGIPFTSVIIVFDWPICKEKYIYIVYIFFETTEQIKIKLDRNDVWKVLYKHSSFHFDKIYNQ